ncbi:hypothetical protein B4135_1404 [Caldibacillus debilis]|uniref:Uncharacterized protein n=1 Tax=Caldibacillus debilis TaxID=301148 RepID=A0A150MCH4_9BACI|nr:hypothetical protein B4135_1404 [Caldibacillus debilis]
MEKKSQFWKNSCVNPSRLFFLYGRRGMRRSPGAAAPSRLLGGNFAKVKNQHRIGRIR